MVYLNTKGEPRIFVRYAALSFVVCAMTMAVSSFLVSLYFFFNPGALRHSTIAPAERHRNAAVSHVSGKSSPVFGIGISVLITSLNTCEVETTPSVAIIVKVYVPAGTEPAMVIRPVTGLMVTPVGAPVRENVGLGLPAVAT